jgi:putative tryptophan/tyrosine transport system substrate-binding protein
MGFGRGSRSAGSRERKDIPPSSVRESCVVRGANKEDEYTFRNAAATAAIPIVFQVGFDPVAGGLVASLSQPGGNITGVTNLSAQVAPKRLELMRKLIPMASDFSVLVNPGTDQYMLQFQGVAGSLGLQLHLVNASSDREFDVAFADLTRLG